MNVRRSACLVLALAVAAAITASTLVARAGSYGSEDEGEEMTLVGTVVDLHSYMTGKYSSDDEKKSTRESIRAGVPAALETEEGLVVIGTGNKGPGRKLLPFAYREVELTGTLYEEDGFEYIDMESIRPVDGEGEENEQLRGRPVRETEEPGKIEPEEEEEE